MTPHCHLHWNGPGSHRAVEVCVKCGVVKLIRVSGIVPLQLTSPPRKDYAKIFCPDRVIAPISDNYPEKPPTRLILDGFCL